VISSFFTPSPLFYLSSIEFHQPKPLTFISSSFALSHKLSHSVVFTSSISLGHLPPSTGGQTPSRITPSGRFSESFHHTVIPDARGSQPSPVSSTGLVVGLILGILVVIAASVVIWLWLATRKPSDEEEAEMQYETESQVSDTSFEIPEDYGSEDGGQIFDEIDDVLSFAEDESIFGFTE
jgi:hypothetical protein